MASITMRINKSGERVYYIRAHTNHKSGNASISWKVPNGWSQNSIDKELSKIAHKLDMDSAKGKIKPRKRVADDIVIKTFKDYCEKVFIPTKERECSESTRYFYATLTRKHFYPTFAKLRIEDITSTQIEAILVKKHSEGLAKSTLNALYITLSQIFKYALYTKAISNNPMASVRKPKYNKAEELGKEKRYKAYTEDEMSYIIECLEKEPLHWRTYISLMIDSACRRGEICGLKWKCVDFENDSIRIENNLCYTTTKGLYEDTPKTKSSIRTIDIDASTMNLLRQLKSEQMRNSILSMDGFVFTQPNSILPITPNGVSEHFRMMQRIYNIPDFHPHKMRHTHATITIQNGGDIASESARLGHNDISTTMNMYVHPNQDGIKKVGDIYRNALKQKRA